MIDYEGAIRIIDEHTNVLGRGARQLVGSVGLRVGIDLLAQCDSPPFDNSAVDGFGRRLEDLDAEVLPLAGEVRAGDDGLLVVPAGRAVRIFTGAPVPTGVGAISMQEDCELVDGAVRFNAKSKPGDHIRPAGSDFKKGEVLLPQGAALTPPMIGLAISGGHTRLEYLVRPRVLLLTTGDELETPGNPLGPGKIYNSNEAALCEALRPLSARTHMMQYGDDADLLKSLIPAMLADNDVLITCGGVSVGEYDYLKEAFAAAGVEERFWSVSIKPGKPFYFGTKGKVLIFGLPGNPVSTLVTFYLFVRPALLKMAGHPNPWPTPVKARMKGSSRKKDGRMEFLRGVLSGEPGHYIVEAVGGRDSHLISGLAAANCLIHFPLDSRELKDGELVQVTTLDWT